MIELRLRSCDSGSSGGCWFALSSVGIVLRVCEVSVGDLASMDNPEVSGERGVRRRTLATQVALEGLARRMRVADVESHQLTSCVHLATNRTTRFELRLTVHLSHVCQKRILRNEPLAAFLAVEAFGVCMLVSLPR